MKRYTVLIHFLIGTEVVELYYYGVETITYYSSGNEIIIGNDSMLTEQIPLYTDLYLQGKNNASVSNNKIISIQVLEKN